VLSNVKEVVHRTDEEVRVSDEEQSQDLMVAQSNESE
jgi:hypothetical protein